MKSSATWAWTVGRLVLGIALVSWLFHRLWSQPKAFDMGTWSPHWVLWMLGGHLLFLSVYTLGVTRWRLLMTAHHIDLSWKRCFTLFFIGHFFNAFMLGSTGGDMIKAFYTARESHHQKTESATLVFLDRLIGLVALIVLVLIILACRLPFLHEQPSLAKAAFYLVMVLAALTILAVLLLSRNWLEKPFWNRDPSSDRRLDLIFSHAGRMYGAVHHFKTKPAILAKAFGLSLFIHAFSLLACCCFSAAIHSGLSVFQCFTLFPLLGVFGAIPITPGGLGFREGAAVVIFGTVGVEPATAFLLSLLPYMSGSVWSLFGGILYLMDPIRRKNPAPSAVRS
jgi:uncharacterized protein (TIRG00374 family)